MSRVIVGSFWIMLFLAELSAGAEPRLRISQYGHASWRVQDGVLAGAPSALTQTSDGYLWVATHSGLRRFDGAKFTEFTPPVEDEGLRSPRILSLLDARDGSLWIGTGADLEHWDGNHLVHYPSTPGLSFGRIFKVIESRSGTVWFVRSGSSDTDGPLCKIENNKIVCIGMAQGLPFEHSGGALVEDPTDGALWLNSDDHLFRWNLQTSVEIPIGVPGVVDAIEAIAFDADGALLLGAEQSSHGLGLSVLRNGRLEAYDRPGLDGRELGVQALFLDSHHALWIGTLREGLYRVNGMTVEHFRMQDGLTSDTVNGFFEDTEGNIWVSTPQGLDRFRDLRIVSYSTKEGLGADSANAVVAARDGTLWISNWRSLDRLENGVVSSLSAKNGLPGEEVTSIFEDHAGRLWVGLDEGLTYLDENRKFTRVRRDNGKEIGLIGAFSESAAGDLWILSEDKPEAIIRLRESKVVEEIARSRMKFAISSALAADRGEGFWIATYEGNLAHWHDGRYELIDFGRPAHTAHIDQLAVLSDGSVIGASAAGLVGWHNGKALTLTARNGLPCAHIWSLQQDKRQDLWLYSECGLLRLTAGDIYQWFNHPDVHVDLRRFDAWDGAQPAKALWDSPSALGPDGRLYFANSSVVQSFDPKAGDLAPPVPPVHIERILADRHNYPVSEMVSLSSRIRDLQIDYTAPSFAVPEKVQFRYRLRGHDDEWVSAGSRRQAFYSGLRPGQYIFDVSAANRDGQWSSKAASIAVIVQPAFYQTRLFIVACCAAVIGLLWLGYTLRIKSIRARMQGRLDAALMERERIAHDLHDTFFQSIQGLLLRFNTGTTTMSESDPARAIFLEALEQSDAVMHEGRRLVFELRPESPRSSLEEALEIFAKSQSLAPNPHVEFHSTGAPLPLHPMVFEELLRMGREALANAFQHARASRIVVEARYESSEFGLTISDNGTGVDITVLETGYRPYHYGVPGMRERARKLSGVFSIGRNTDWSTEVQIRVPAEVAYQVRRAVWQ